ncbi:hypothetical protein CDAR_250111, partial [Caerostris darwini]
GERRGKLGVRLRRGAPGDRILKNGVRRPGAPGTEYWKSDVGRRPGRLQVVAPERRVKTRCGCWAAPETEGKSVPGAHPVPWCAPAARPPCFPLFCLWVRPGQKNENQVFTLLSPGAQKRPYA